MPLTTYPTPPNINPNNRANPLWPYTDITRSLLARGINKHDAEA